MPSKRYETFLRLSVFAYSDFTLNNLIDKIEYDMSYDGYNIKIGRS